MHLRKRVFRHFIVALTLATLALPLANVQSANAQTPIPTTAPPVTLPADAFLPHGCTPSSATTSGTCLVDALPPVAFNPIGVPHTVTFLCDAATFGTGSGVNAGFPAPATTTPPTPATYPAGCYDVQATVTDATTGSQTPINSSTCGGVVAGQSGGTVDCSSYASPICPVGSSPRVTGAIVFPPVLPGTIPCIPNCPATVAGATVTPVTPTGTTPVPAAAACSATGLTAAQCTAAGGTFDAATGTCTLPVTPGATPANAATVTINPGAPHTYLFTFTGLVPASASGGCPAGTTATTVVPTVSIGIPPIHPAATLGSFCSFSVSAEKKYVEVNRVILTPVPGTCVQGARLIFVEGLKAFFGPPCLVIPVATGTVVLKTGVDCTLEPKTGTAAPPPFPPGSVYDCSNGSLSVVNIPLPNVQLTLTTTGVGSFMNLGGLNGFCGGGTGAGSTSLVATSGTTVQICPTGPGTGTVAACFGPTLNNQPLVCSNAISFSFTIQIPRVVPYVRWAGEKIELKKCFGAGFAFEPVEFTLKSSSPSLNATLLPATLATGVAGATAPGTTGNEFPTQNTIWTSTDADGCALVLGYADGEGVMYVDAAIFSTSGSGLIGSLVPPTSVTCSGTGVPEPAAAGSGLPPEFLVCSSGTVTAVTCPANTTATGPFGAPAVGSASAACRVVTSPSATAGFPIVNEHAFQVFYLKFDHVDLENIAFATPYQSSTALQPYLTEFAGQTPPIIFGSGGGNILSGGLPPGFTLPGPPGSGQITASVAVCATQYVRAMVHGYFEIPGDPSGRPATNVPIPGAPYSSGGPPSTGSYVLPAGRWTLPEDWPVLATFAGFGLPGQLKDFSPSPIYFWDLNSGWVFNPTSERPDLCVGNGTFAPPINTLGAISVASSVDTGPCWGIDQTGQWYSTAPLCGNGTGITVGIGPFDATQACTTPFPLTYTPSGATAIGTAPAGTPAAPSGTFNCPAGVTAPCLVPVHNNSTYLPNGTVNEWDAPMPPAQVSFGVTAGPGALDQVNKTGLYALTLDVGKPTASGCPSGYSVNPATGTCQFEFNPNPFYSEAIPASPFIPPVTNNGGYLWNSWNFTAGQVFSVRATPAVGGTPAVLPGGFVQGESTSFTLAAGTCPPGFTFTAGTPATCSMTTAAGTTTFAAPAAGTYRGGTNLSFFGEGTSATTAACPTPAGGAGTGTSTVTVADIRGFAAGERVSAYLIATGADVPFTKAAPAGGITSALTVTGVTPAPTAAFPNAGTLTFSEAVTAPCLAPFEAVFYTSSFGLPVANSSVFTIGQLVTIGTPQGSVGGAVTFVDTTNNIVYVGSANAVAVGLTGGACFGISRPATSPGSLTPVAPVPAPAGNPCEPATLVPPGTLLFTGPVGAGGEPAESSAPPNPYPFWQWIPSPPAAATAQAPTAATCSVGSATLVDGAAVCASGTIVAVTCPSGTAAAGAGTATATCVPTAGNLRAATVYSDNHGEAVVSLSTGIASQIPPLANGTCPTGYLLIPATTASVAFCLLQFQALASPALAGGAFANVAAALSGLSSTNPGCVNTTATGAVTPAPGATVGANGPAAGQICVNAFGGIELGAGAALGTTTVQAVADYPYTRGEHPPVASNVVTKVWTSQFAKTVNVGPATPGPAGTTSYTVTITAVDICGIPIFGEPINVYALTPNGGAVVLSPVSVGAVLSTSSNSATVLVRPDTGTATLSLEVLSSALTGGLVIKVVFPFERIERFVTVVPGSTPGAVTSVNYGAGWQMVGGPASSNFASAQALFSYSSTGYVDASSKASNISSAAPSCTGYWAYFAAPMSIGLNSSSKAGDTASCTLAAGWNLVGNPFGSAASLPSGVTAYHWNGTGYDVVGQIPVGGAVWIYNGGSLNSLTQTAS